MLSKYCSDIADKYGIKVGGVNKLVPDLKNKSKYVVHCRNLQLYFSLGMKLTKVYRILKFKQSNWLKKYIKFNTDKRKYATDIYGKTMENIRKRINIELINNAKDYLKCICRPHFISQENI